MFLIMNYEQELQEMKKKKKINRVINYLQNGMAIIIL